MKHSWKEQNLGRNFPKTKGNTRYFNNNNSKKKGKRKFYGNNIFQYSTKNDKEYYRGNIPDTKRLTIVRKKSIKVSTKINENQKKKLQYEIFKRFTEEIFPMTVPEITFLKQNTK